MVEPGQAWADACWPVFGTRPAVWKTNLAGMRPRPNDKTAFLRDMRGGLTANGLEIAQLSWQEWIVPPCHQQDGGLKGFGAVFPVDRQPIGISVGVQHPVVEKRNIVYRAIVCLDQRP